MKGTSYVTVMNQIFVTFTAIAGYQSPSFMANIGLRYFNKTWEDMSFQLNGTTDTMYDVSGSDLKDLQ